MSSFRTIATVFVASLAVAGCSSHAGTDSAIPAVPQSTTTVTNDRDHALSARAMAVTPLCPMPTGISNVASCNILIRSDLVANPFFILPTSSLPGLHPSELQSAYGISNASSQGGNQTVGIVVAYDNPLLPLDLNVYRAEFGMPPCTQFNGCLRINYAPTFRQTIVSSWAAEADLDVEMVSAICPKCKIVVSEAASDQIGDLANAVSAAIASGATVVSNSYTIAENPSLTQYDRYYSSAHVPMTAGAGDDGYGPGYPASSPNVTAVGGTTLAMSGSSVTSETVWNSTGSGCSTIEAKPAWQTDAGCAMRTVNDVAVVGDPATGVAAYVTAFGGWNVFGGTSVGSPVVASMFALAGNASSVGGPQYLYAHSGTFRQITGSNASCSPAYLCNASAQYNGPAGLGTPKGLDAF